MTNKILLNVVTPDKLLLNKKVDIVVATSKEGEFGVLAGHVPFLATLTICEVRYKEENNNIFQYIALCGGFCEVTAKTITILAEIAELADEIDIDRAKYVYDHAKQCLTKYTQEHLQINNDKYIKAKKNLQYSMIRMRVAKHANV